MEFTTMTITNEDNMLLMARYDDNYFDLAIVDPPYGVHKRLLNGAGHMKNSPQRMKYKENQWDKEIPFEEYFVELFRVSRNQIIWGGNYFGLPKTRCVIAWVKPTMKNHPHFSQWEMGWTSFDSSAKVVYNNPANSEGKSIHPTQKPIKLYEWLLHNYAKQGDKILDTHGGSMSIAIACHNLKFDLTTCELDEEYYKDGLKRLENHKKQLRMF